MKGTKAVNKSVKLDASPAYDLYWRFAAERQAVFLRRLNGVSSPWTSDPILQLYKFTNAYRASVRTSQYLIQKVIYNNQYPDSAVEVVFRIILFKLFNRISTWEKLQRSIGLLTWQSFKDTEYDRVLTALISNGERIYSAAYIIPPVKIGGGMKHRGHLSLLDSIMRGDFVVKLGRTKSLRGVFELLKDIPSFGDFLAFQLAIDLNYSSVIDHLEDNFVVAGPGARDGLAKVFPGETDAKPEMLIAKMMERQESEFERLGLDFASLWGRRLQLIDCQNLFCEISKYTRVSNPEIVGISGRTRIKQAFRPHDRVLQPWYPPKWDINALIPKFPATIRL